MTKRSILLCFVILFPGQPFPYEKFTKDLPADWSYKTGTHQIKITRNKKIGTYYCGYNNAGWEDTLELRYEIVIDRTKIFSKAALDRRIFLRDSLQQALEKNYQAAPHRMNASRLMYFEATKDKVDSLRLPFYQDDQYSYFITDNFPDGHCFAKEALEEETKRVFRDILEVK